MLVLGGCGCGVEVETRATARLRCAETCPMSTNAPAGFPLGPAPGIAPSAHTCTLAARATARQAASGSPGEAEKRVRCAACWHQQSVGRPVAVERPRTVQLAAADCRAAQLSQGETSARLASCVIPPMRVGQPGHAGLSSVARSEYVWPRSAVRSGGPPARAGAPAATCTGGTGGTDGARSRSSLAVAAPSCPPKVVSRPPSPSCPPKVVSRLPSSASTRKGAPRSRAGPLGSSRPSPSSTPGAWKKTSVG